MTGSFGGAESGLGDGDDAGEVRRAGTLGVQTCMVKPYSGADVLERIAKLLKPAKPSAPLTRPAAGSLPAPARQEFLL